MTKMLKSKSLASLYSSSIGSTNKKHIMNIVEKLQDFYLDLMYKKDESVSLWLALLILHIFTAAIILSIIASFPAQIISTALVFAVIRIIVSIFNN